MLLEKDGGDQTHQSCKKMKKCYTESRREGLPYVRYKEGKLTGFITSCVELPSKTRY
jgi:hypothetical protein